jgi:hypothetical protein
MGAATKGGGAVESGPRNKMLSKTSQTSGPIMMKEGGDVSPRKRMAMGESPVKMMGGGMMKKGYAVGGMVKKGYAAGGAVKKKKMMASGGKGR